MRRVYANRDASQVHIRRAWLEAHGIPSAVHGEGLTSALGEVPPTMLFVELWVPDDRAAEALRLLARHEGRAADGDEGYHGRGWRASSLSTDEDTMARRIHRVEYFYTTVEDRPGEAYHLLARLAELGANLLAFTAVPVGPDRTQLSLCPADPRHLEATAREAGLALDGPHRALLVQGDDELGALAGVHEQLFENGVNVYASFGVTDGEGSFGYLIYVRPEEFERAARALGI